MADIPAFVSASDLAKLFGMSAQAISTLNNKGVLHKTPRGLYDVRQSIRDYVTFRALPQNSENAQALRAEKLKAETEQIRLKTAITRGELLLADQIHSEWASVAADLRSSIIAIPSRIGAQLGFDRAAVAALDAELRDALSAVADRIAGPPDPAPREAGASPSPDDAAAEPELPPGGNPGRLRRLRESRAAARRARNGD